MLPVQFHLYFLILCCCSFTYSCPTLGPHGLQYPRLPCPSLHLPEFAQTHVHWVGDAISSSVTLLSSCPQYFPTSGSFPVSRLFASGSQSIGASASASVLPMNIQGWLPSGLTGLIPLLSKGTLKSLLQHHSLKASVLQCSAFFMVQLSHPYMTIGKTITLTVQTFL